MTIIMLLNLSPTRTGARSNHGIHHSKISNLVSARSARSSKSVTSLQNLTSGKAVKQKALPSFLRETRATHRLNLSVTQARILLPIEELLGDGEYRVPGDELRRALDKGKYRDDEVVLTVQGVSLLCKDLKPVVRQAEFPVKVVEAVFRLLQSSISTNRVFPYTVYETTAVLKGQGESRPLEGYE